MRDLAKRAEVAANVAIVVVAVLLVAVLTKQHLFPAPGGNPAERPASRQVLRSGDPVVLADVDWRKNGKTLLLVVSTTCHFCTRSGPFYQRLVKDHGDAQLVALVPQTASEGMGYLKQLGVDIGDVRQVSLKSLGVSGTPALILVDGGGKVADAWTGALPPDKEEEVISRLRAERASR